MYYTYITLKQLESDLLEAANASTQNPIPGIRARGLGIDLTPTDYQTFTNELVDKINTLNEDSITAGDLEKVPYKIVDPEEKGTRFNYNDLEVVIAQCHPETISEYLPVENRISIEEAPESHKSIIS